MKHLLLLATALTLLSCSMGSKLSSPQTAATQTPIIGTQTGCNTPLTVTATYNPTNLALVNGEVVTNITLVASGRCGRFRLVETSRYSSFIFSSRQTFQITLTSYGNNMVDLQVEALDLDNNVIDTQDLNLQINVLAPNPSPSPSSSPSASASPSPSPSPSSSPSSSPSPSPSPSSIACNISITGPVANGNGTANGTDKLPLFLGGSGPIVRAYINNEPVNINSNIALSALYPNSGQYRASLDVEDVNHNVVNCLRTHLAPTVGLNVVSVTPTAAQFEVLLYGPVTATFLDGERLNQPAPPENKITYTKTLSGPGNFTALAEVINLVTGDKASLQKPYCVPQAITAVGDNWSANYKSNNGYQISSSNNKVKAGTDWVFCDSSRPSCWTVRALERNFNIQMKTTDIIRVPTAQQRCPDDHPLWIGEPPANADGTGDLWCAKSSTLNGLKIKLINETDHPITIVNDPYIQCPAGKVAVGRRVDHIGDSYIYHLFCRTPVDNRCNTY